REVRMQYLVVQFGQPPSARCESSNASHVAPHPVRSVECAKVLTGLKSLIRKVLRTPGGRPRAVFRHWRARRSSRADVQLRPALDRTFGFHRVETQVDPAVPAFGRARTSIQRVWPRLFAAS